MRFLLHNDCPGCGVDGETIVVSCQNVIAAVAVRYAWEDDTVTSLRNREGLPASPFRTNTW